MLRGLYIGNDSSSLYYMMFESTGALLFSQVWGSGDIHSNVHSNIAYTAY